MHDSAAQKVEETRIAERITVRGIVQGVGFRPTVWQIAKKFDIRGSVLNNGVGVEIFACGTETNINLFANALTSDAPKLSRIDSIERTPTNMVAEVADFQIVDSDVTAIQTGIVPDASVCEDCRAETFDPFARRFRYPFTNCTNCGPRLSIIENIPYDRASTTMRAFEMCVDCRAEYDDPSDRRFHAQPVACHICGPKVWLERADGKTMSVDSFTMLDDADAALTLIQRGHIIAIKGTGGFQFACDATNDEAVSRLRELKHRERKPFALMVRDLDIAGEFCEISDVESDLLQNSAAPVVILRRVQTSKFKVPSKGEKKITRFRPEQADLSVSIATSVAPGLNTLGVMLPNTPLHHLISKRMTRPIVLTSGNISDEPQCIDNDSATKKLGKIADYFLMNDRPIAQRIDDSVVKVMAGEPRVFRRARGLAPSYFVMPRGFDNAPSILAFGGELKNTFCLLLDGKATVSQHIGDLEDAETQADYRHNLKLYETLYQHRPTVLACDLHPEYLSGKLARERAEKVGLPLIETQHHHAHIAACLAENNVPLDAAPVIGVALDGLGFGVDGTLWGGEFLLADYVGYRRLGTFKPVALIGGEQAIKEPWRNIYAHLVSEMGWARFALNYSELELFTFLEKQQRATLDAMMTRNLNSPLASSAGRLFDAAAAAIGICRDRAAYEGQGAVELEAAVDEDTLYNEEELLAYPFAIPRLPDSNLPYIEPYAMWQALLGDLVLQTPAPVIAARFHKGLAKIIVQMIEKLSKYESGDEAIKTVALSGGVWQNKVLLEQVVGRLQQSGFTVLTHRLFPTNDGALSLGQAAIAAARSLSEPPAVAGG